VGHVQHSDTRGAKALDHFEEHADLLAAEARRRLIHDHHLGVDRKRLGDFDELLVGYRQR
jgi:hypothetical protein